MSGAPTQRSSSSNKPSETNRLSDVIVFRRGTFVNKEGGWEWTLLKATQSFCILHTLTMRTYFSFGKECREEDLFRVFLRFPWLFYLLEVDTVKE